MAIAHGAGLMLVPIYLGLCRVDALDGVHRRLDFLINADFGMALVGLPHPLYRNDRGWRMLGVAGLPLSGPEVRLTQLVQSRRSLGSEPRFGGIDLSRLQLLKISFDLVKVQHFVWANTTRAPPSVGHGNDQTA